MMSGRSWVLVAGLTLATAHHARAQEGGTSSTDTLVLRALDLEDSKPRDAAVLYRRALAGESMIPRCWD